MRATGGAMTRLLVVCACAFNLVGIVVAQAPPAQRPDPRNIQLRGNRFKPLKYDEMTPAQKTMVEHLIAGPRGGVNGPFNVLLRSPEIGDLGQEFGGAARFKSSLPQRSEEHTSELQSHHDLVCRLPLEKKNDSRLSPRTCR